MSNETFESKPDWQETAPSELKAHNEQEDEAIDETENKETIQSIIQTLKEVVAQAKTLEDESNDLLYNKKDASGSIGKIEERAQLLVDLPARLTGNLEKIDRVAKDDILTQIDWLAQTAQKGLDEHKEFMLLALLSNQGSDIGDKNKLEQLIERLENN
jgi:hypothetical protein